MEVAATPEQIWEGLTNPELTRRYYLGQASTPTCGPDLSMPIVGATENRGDGHCTGCRATQATTLDREAAL
jgi:uncharacterized protein YndB with AHSA1/START domain